MKIVYLSGIDGCGKTTQAKLLVEAFNQNRINAEYVWLRYEPSFKIITNIIHFIVVNYAFKNNIKRSVIGENRDNDHKQWVLFKRKLLKNVLISKLWFIFSSSDYFISYKKRIKMINADVIVVDRYVDDFIIDYSINSGINAEQIDMIKECKYLNKFRIPDYKIIIDIPASDGYLRKNDGTSKDYLALREKYYSSIKGENTLHVDGLEIIDILHEKIRCWIFKRLGGKI